MRPQQSLVRVTPGGGVHPWWLRAPTLEASTDLPVKRTCESQGVPVTVTDPLVLAQVASVPGVLALQPNSVCLGSCRLPGLEARSTDFGLSAGILAAGPVPTLYAFASVAAV
jgi:hypothetical protein